MVRIVTVLTGLALSGLLSDVALSRSAPQQEEYYSTAKKDITSSDRRRADALRVKTINSIRSLLKKKSIQGVRKFELYLRLGELHAERHDYLRDQEIFDFEKRYDTWAKNGKKGKQPKISHKKSRNHLAKAANAFRTLVRLFPKHKRTATALYSLGKTLARLDDDSSILYFNQLISKHRKSPLVPDAYISMGEYYFEKYDMTKARNAYQKSLRWKKHKAYPYAVYKLGWTHYNAKVKTESQRKAHIDKAITSFKLAIRLANQDKRHNLGRLNLKQEAIGDLIMVWTETEDTKAAWSYFKTIDETDSFYVLLERLGNLYANQGRNKSASEVFARLLREAPERADNYKYHEKLVRLYEGRNQGDRVVSTLKDMNQTYVKDGPWLKANDEDKARVGAAQKLVEKNLYKYATLYHSLGDKSKSKTSLKRALSLYGVYLGSFKQKAYDVRYFYADILFSLGKFKEASHQYTLVAEADTKKGKHLNNAALNAVVAYNKYDAGIKYKKLPPKGQVPNPIELPETKKGLVKVMDSYVKWLPSKKDSYAMRYAAASTFFDYGHYNVAIDRYKKIIADIPKTSQAEASARMVVGYAMEKGMWSDAVKLCGEYIGNKSLKTKKLTTYLVGIKRKAMYSEAQELEKSKKYAEAGRSFLAFQREFSWDKKGADKALHNASNNFRRAGMLEDAVAADMKLIDKYPKSHLAGPAMLNVGKTYEALAQYDKAASYYKAFSVSYPRDELASGSLFNAGVLYAGLGDAKQAESVYSRFASRYKKDPLYGEVLFSLARLQEREKKYKSAAKSYSSAAMANKGVADRYYHGKAKSAFITHKYLNRSSGMREIRSLRSALSKKNAPPALEARRLIAEAMFSDTEPRYRKFVAAQLNDSTRIEKDVASKQRSLERLAKDFEAIIAVESPEYTVAALYRLGLMHENFSESLFSAPAPRGATQIEVSQFKSTIEKVAFPLRDEAYKFFEAAFKRSQEVETFTVWTQLTYDKMAELAPTKNPEVVEQSVRPNYMAHRVDYKIAASDLLE